MTSPVKRSVVIGGRKTSVSLEEGFWTALLEIADSRGVTAYDLVAEIDNDCQQGNLASAVQLFVLAQYRKLVDGGGVSAG